MGEALNKETATSKDFINDIMIETYCVGLLMGSVFCSRKLASNSCLQLSRYFGGHDHKPQKDYTNLKSFMNTASAGIVGLSLPAIKHFCDHI